VFHALAQTASGDDNTAAWLAFAGAILVALIAAVTAQRRLHVQLAHDRELGDLAELRKILDEAAATTWTFLEKGADVYITSVDWFESEPGSEAEDTSARAALAARSIAYRVLWPTDATQGRLVLRLGDDHEVTQAFARWRAVARHYLKPLGTRPAERPTPGDEWSQQLKEARHTFIEKAKPITRSRIQAER
jgi:hypothetical protein